MSDLRDSPRGRGGCRRRRKGRGSSEPALSAASAGSWPTPPLCPILCSEDTVTAQLNSSGAGRRGERNIHQPNASKVWLWLFYLFSATLKRKQLSSFQESFLDLDEWFRHKTRSCCAFIESFISTSLEKLAICLQSNEQNHVRSLTTYKKHFI